jgi:acyl carrier protein
MAQMFRRMLNALIEALDDRSPALKAIQSRPLLDDQAFYEAFYRDTGIPEAIPVRLRAMLVHQLGTPWQRVHPTDKLYELDLETDVMEIMFEVGEEFHIPVSSEALEHLDWSFNSVVRYIAAAQRP